MEQFIIHCTPEQTKKALELGAPIEFEVECPVDFETWERSPYPDIKMGKDGEPILILPTAEQMIGWLEEQKIFVHIAPYYDICCNWFISSIGYNKDKYTSNVLKCKTRKEATLAAIDAALDYLENNR